MQSLLSDTVAKIDETIYLTQQSTAPLAKTCAAFGKIDGLLIAVTATNYFTFNSAQEIIFDQIRAEERAAAQIQFADYCANGAEPDFADTRVRLANTKTHLSNLMTLWAE